MPKTQIHNQLSQDLKSIEQQFQGRRKILSVLGGVATSLVLSPLVGCGDDENGLNVTSTTGTGTTGTGTTGTGTTGTGTTGTGTTGTGSTETCSVIPTETAGPYPADGTNGNGGGTINVLTQTGVVRSNIASSFGTSSTQAPGIPLLVKLRLVDTNNYCAALSNYAIYLWHCDAQGRYSLYSSGITAENYCRGVQTTDNNGYVTFQTIFPGCYDGRWPHMHFEIFSSLANAATARNSLKISQLALPASVCNSVYSQYSGIYTSSLSNLSKTSLASDNVFRDNQAINQVATITGSIGASNLTATIIVGI